MVIIYAIRNSGIHIQFGEFMLNVGDKAPSFSLPNEHGDMVSLEDFRGKKVVLWFYPKASTPG